ncbi:MAG: hypothetical protein DRN21_05130 [Thermoplasmata archaeon]|nr:MAG: Hsp20/alpha crystallin family protein [Thermoplasmata archaeon]RLF34292.1 MAG: hypothetical protein DRN07_00280 [Thermoplasmata archaeon]RLF38454.1 MAG: hypothetical protein DRN21_05130 [Thermoplasmata archaeon]HDN50825.1 Hsp20/alpha crystallin family protein [Thermoplasmatales archaeon]
MIFDDEKQRKKDAEEFERIVREMGKIIEEAFKNTPDLQSFIRGFSLKVGEHEQPLMETMSPERDEADIVADENKLYVTLDMPYASEKNIKIKLKHDILEIKATDEIKTIKLPAKVKKKYRKTFRNGVLDLEFEKM